jgi:hypothetical protein
MKNRGKGLGSGDEGLPAADASQHHSLNLSLGSRWRRNLKKEFFFLKEPCGNVIENKGTCGFNPGMLLKAKELNKTLGISEHQETTRPSPKLNGEMPRVTS